MNLALRRGDRAVPPEEAKKIFESAEYGFLSLVSDDEYPYAVPVSFAIAGKSAYIHCAPEGRKIGMILRNRARASARSPAPRPSPKSLRCATIAPSLSAG